MDRNKRKENMGSDGSSHVRHLILAVAVFFLSSLMSTSLAFNAAYVVMANTSSSSLFAQFQRTSNLTASSAVTRAAVPVEEIPFDWAPSYLPLSLQRYPFNAVQRSFSFAGAFAGGLLGTFPMIAALRRFGAHMTMFAIGILSALLCGFTPQALAASFELFVVLRFVSGFIAANVMPLMGVIIEDWAAMSEKGLFVSVLTAHLDISQLFTLLLAPVIAEKVNWPTVFYVHGVICAFFSLAWLIFYRDDPSTHPMISFSEIDTIKTGKGPATTRADSPSYRAVLSSAPVWAILTAAVGTVFVGQFMGIFSPQYFTTALGYSPTVTGTLTIIPTVAALPVKMLTGVLSDRLSMLSEVAKLRLFNSLSHYLGALFLVVVLFVPPATNIPAATALIILPFLLQAFTTGGFHKAVVLIARQHASFVFGTIHIFAMLSLLSGSFLFPLMTPDNSFEQWRIVFGIFVIVLIVSNTVFIIFVRAEPEAWAERKMEFDQLSEEPRQIQSGRSVN